MTQSTEQDRADFEAHFKHLDLTQEPDAWGVPRYKHASISLAWQAWQAARRAQVVPDGWKRVPVEPTDCQLKEAVKSILECTWTEAQDSHEFNSVWLEAKDAYAAMLAAAPQPPEADSNSHEFDGIKPEAAPVQMPEPVGVLRVFEPHEGAGVACTEATINATNLSHGWHTLYTEQQVRQLLASHGIKAAP